MRRKLSLLLLLAALALPSGVALAEALPVVERVTTMVPYPRGLAVVDGELYVLARGRVRGPGGGASAAIDDRAGTLFAVDPKIAEPRTATDASDAIRNNGRVVAEPTEPPFRLWDRSSSPPEADEKTDRPYCTLRWHEPTRSFYLCAFSGVDLAKKSATDSAFSKNLTDGLLRYDTRTGKWYEVERHNPSAGWAYPHHDPATNPPPHGWLKGPDNCLPLGRWLYTVAKDNSVLVRYDLAALESDPEAGHPPAELIMDEVAEVAGHGTMTMEGQSGLAYHNGWLYISYRTTSEIIRIRLDAEFNPVQPIRAELVARFDPWDRERGVSPDITDIDLDEAGRLYVLCASPARVFRFTPDPANVFEARGGAEQPWRDLAALTNNAKMKSENILFHEGYLYVTSGDGYGYQAGAEGTVYRVRVGD